MLVRFFEQRAAAKDQLSVATELQKRQLGANAWFVVDQLATRLRLQGCDTETVERRAKLAEQILESKKG